MRKFTLKMEKTAFLSRHELRHGNLVSIVGHHGNPIYSEPDGRLHASHKDVYYGAVWTVEHHGSNFLF